MKLNRLTFVALIVTVAFSSFTARKGTLYYFQSNGGTNHTAASSYDPPTATPIGTIGGANNQLAWIAIEDLDFSSAIDAAEFSAAYDALDQTPGGNTTLNDDTEGTRSFTVSSVTGNAILELKP